MPAKLEYVEYHRDVFESPVRLLDKFVNFGVGCEVHYDIQIGGVIGVSDTVFEIVIRNAKILEERFYPMRPRVRPHVDSENEVPLR